MVAVMKIAVVQPKFNTGGGAERYALNLSQGLSRRGHDLHLFGRKARHLPDGVCFHRIWALAAGRALKTWSFARSAQWRVARGNFAIVHGSGKTYCQNVHRLGGGLHRTYLQKMGKPANAWYDRVALALEERLMRAITLKAIICPSRWVQEDLLRVYPGVAGIVHVITNGVDLDAFAYCPDPQRRRDLRWALPDAARTPVLLFVAANFWLKGLDRAIALMPHLPDTVLMVIGGDHPQPFMDQARGLGVAERVRFMGAQTNMAACYQAADLLLHPTRFDPVANVCLEALACGTPVVTTARAGTADLLHDGRGGAVMDPAAGAEPAARLIRELLSWGVKGRRQARQLVADHSHEAHLDHIEALYRRITDPYQGAAANDHHATQGIGRNEGL
jgi:UDP-glucose:(heptosyl)LPS alpha-1,3-glucosyltransferase